MLHDGQIMIRCYIENAQNLVQLLSMLAGYYHAHIERICVAL